MGGTFLGILLAAVGDTAPKSVPGCTAVGADKAIASRVGALTRRKLKCSDEDVGSAEVYVTMQGETVREVQAQARDELAQAALGVAANDLVAASQAGGKAELAYARHNGAETLFALTASHGDFSWKLADGKTDEARIKATIAKHVGARIVRKLPLPVPSVGSQTILVQTFAPAESFRAAKPGWSIVHLLDAKGASKGRIFHRFPGSWGMVAGSLGAFPLDDGTAALSLEITHAAMGVAESQTFFFDLLPEKHAVREVGLTGRSLSGPDGTVSVEPERQGKDVVLVLTKDGKTSTFGTSKFDEKARDYECPPIPEDLTDL